MKIHYDDHYTGGDHVFDTTRKSAHIADAIRAREPEGVRLLEPPAPAIAAAAAGIHHLHTGDYVDALRTGADRPLAQSQGFEWCDGIWPMAVHSTAGVIAATDAALDDGVAGSLSAGLHHAKPGRGDGFCTVNGLAVAAARLVGIGLQVVVLDLDAHCGGGTAAMLRAHDLSGSVRHLDLATDSFDNYTPVHRDDRLVIVEYGTEAAYLGEVEAMLDRTTAAGADLVLYNAGVDIHPGLSKATVARREQMVFERLAAETTPVAWVLAGGYTHVMTMDELVDLHWHTIDAALDAAA